jgi:hypothetical protein
MSISIMDCLLNSQTNFKNLKEMGGSIADTVIFKLAYEQLSTAIAALEKDKDIYDMVDY